MEELSNSFIVNEKGDLKCINNAFFNFDPKTIAKEHWHTWEQNNNKVPESFLTGYYIDENNRVQCRINGKNTGSQFESVCFLYDEMPTGTLLFLKHGDKEFCSDVRKYSTKQLYNSNLKIVVIDANFLKVNPELLEDVNKVLNIFDYINKFIKKYDILPII